MMPRFNFSLLCRLIDRFKCIVCFSLRWIVAVHRALAGYCPLTIGWSLNRKSTKKEPEISSSERDLIEVVEKESEHGAVIVERLAEPVVKQPEYRSSEEDDDDFNSEEYRVETTDNFYCEYDSTWEIEEPQEGPSKNTWRQTSSKFRRFQNAAKDMQNYRRDYPSQRTSQPWKETSFDAKPNLNFYLGNTPTSPDGVFISQFHDDWFRNYDKLERVHSYIQWLFPLPEPGMNYEATTLTREEIKEFCKSSIATENLLKSYTLMLDFYGIELCNKKTGEVRKAPHWEKRFINLDRNTHNNLRITRILKCLGILGFPHYQVPLVQFFLEETLIHEKLPRVKESVLNYFLFSVRDKRKRKSLIKFAFENIICQEEFVWCPKKIQQIWSRQSHSERSKSQKRMNRMFESEN